MSSVIHYPGVLFDRFSYDRELHIFLRFADSEPNNLLNEKQNISSRILGQSLQKYIQIKTGEFIILPLSLAINQNGPGHSLTLK